MLEQVVGEVLQRAPGRCIGEEHHAVLGDGEVVDQREGHAALLGRERHQLAGVTQREQAELRVADDEPLARMRGDRQRPAVGVGQHLDGVTAERQAHHSAIAQPSEESPRGVEGDGLRAGQRRAQQLDALEPVVELGGRSGGRHGWRLPWFGLDAAGPEEPSGDQHRSRDEEAEEPPANQGVTPASAAAPQRVMMRWFRFSGLPSG